MIPDRIERRMRPARLGMIGLGVRVDDHAQEVNYFVVGEEIAKIYGGAPPRLPVRFPWPEPEQVLHSVAYVLRKGRSVVGRCDGRQFIEIQATGKDLVRPCKLPPDDDYAQCPLKCRASARLDVVVAKVAFGIWQVRVGGAQRIADLLGQLRLYRAAVGPLTQFPFEIERVEVQEQYFNAKGEVAWRMGYPIRVRSPYSVEQVAAIQEARGLPVALPPAPHEEDILDEDEPNGEPTREPDSPKAAPSSRGSVPASDGESEYGQRTGESAAAVAREAPPPAPAGEEIGRSEAGRHTAAESPGITTRPAPAPVKADSREPVGAAPGGGWLPYVPGEDTGDDWDMSMCFKAAATLGVSTTMYERYLQNQYHARSGDLSDEDVRRERRRLEIPGDGQAVKRLVAEMAMVASGGRKGA